MAGGDFTNATTTSNADEVSFAELVSYMVIDAAYSATVMRPLVRVESLVGKPSDTLKFPIWPALTAAAVAETADLANTAINTTSVSITAGEVGIMASVTDEQSEDDIFSGLGPYGSQLGRALADKWDADLAALLAGHSNESGTTATALTQADFLAAIRALDARDAPKPYVAVLHPVQVAQLGNDIVTNGGSIWSQGGGRGDARFGSQGEMWGNLFGVDIFQSTNVSNDGTDYDGAIFSRGQAHGMVVKREARVEPDRDASMRLSEIVVTARYGVGELVDSYGQTITSGMTA